MKSNVSSVVALDKQFRMHPSICELSSSLFYDNLLQPSEIVLPELNIKLHLPCWPTAKISVEKNAWLRVNLMEVSAICDIVDALVSGGLPEHEIGILCAYTDQVEYVQLMLSHNYSQIEVHTIDRFQGRDKTCIILSLVVNKTISEFSLLSDRKRLNVALTRARKKLIILGNYKVLNENQNFKNLFAIIIKYNAIIK
ncbi:hypothetical protein MXB_897 [Myxobolus squamalis]|nr:hypothetical protein MXB_897 [Myxobolus squamalis]